MGGDAEVVLAGFHGPPEIAVGGRVGVDEATVSKDHLYWSVSCVNVESHDLIVPRNSRHCHRQILSRWSSGKVLLQRMH